MDGLIIDEDIKNRIYTIRNMQVMFDRDLAKLYDFIFKVTKCDLRKSKRKTQEIFTLCIYRAGCFNAFSRAIQTSIHIINSFVKMRQFMTITQIINKQR